MRVLLLSPSHTLLLVVLCFLTLSSAATADSYTVAAVPHDVTGPAGTTVGWGFDILNESTSDWLVLTNVTAGGFADGTPNSLFDFPILAPGAEASEKFDAVSGVGLYELTWDSNAPTGFVNRGLFVVSAQWWSDNPLVSGVFLADAGDESSPYSATVSGVTSAPEPGAWPFLAAALGLLALRSTRRATSLRANTRETTV